MTRPAASALVLSGGAARRLGGQKAERSVGDATLLERSLRVALEAADDVLLLPGSRTHAAPAGVRIVADPGCGPLGALASGLAAARHETCLLLACDQPFLASPVLARLLEALRSSDAVVLVDGRGRQPFPSAWHRRVLPLARRQLVSGVRSLRGLLDVARTVELPASSMSDVDPDLLGLLDVDTEEDLRRARALVPR